MNKVPFLPLGLLWPFYNTTYGFVDFGRVCRALDVYPASDEKMVETLGLRYGGIRFFKAQSSHFKDGYAAFVSREITRLDKEVSPFLWNRIHSLLPRDSVVGLASLLDLHNESWQRKLSRKASLTSTCGERMDSAAGSNLVTRKRNLDANYRLSAMDRCLSFHRRLGRRTTSHDQMDHETQVNRIGT